MGGEWGNNGETILRGPRGLVSVGSCDVTDRGNGNDLLLALDS